ncbi:MAG: hypothetical protein U5K54_12665 [Cytophagales bacterium]|nr:hypothetical protein [Cytophagales bacterium]
MENLSFDVRDSYSFFEKLKEEFKELELNPTSTRTAINFSMTAFHLTYWLYWKTKTENEIKEIKGDYKVFRNKIDKELKDFVSEIKSSCPEIQIVHDITNGSKHAVLVRHTRHIDSTEKIGGGFSLGFSKGFNIPCLLVKVDNKEMYFDEIANKVMMFCRIVLG